MEARRREQQQRRASAKSNAIQSLPSTQEEEFNLRLIDLYAMHPCLWNRSHKEFGNVNLKQQIWQQITHEMGDHLNSLFLRRRLNQMQHQFYVYKLQILNYNIRPVDSRKPEKPYYFDKLASTMDIEQDSDQTDEGIDLETKSSNLSIASIVKERIKQQREENSRRQETPRSAQSNESPRSSETVVDNLDSKNADNQDNQFSGIPSVVKKRLKIKYNALKNKMPPTSMTSLPQLPTSLRAQPGDSVSKTKVTTRLINFDESQAMSEDEDFHRLHLIVRQEGRSLRRKQHFIQL